jgi:hypothetical protein
MKKLRQMKTTLQLIFIANLLFCTINAQICIPTPGSCPSYVGCTYQPSHYLTFDNACAPLDECYIGGQVYAYSSAVVTSQSGSPMVGNYQRLVTNQNGWLQETFTNPFFDNGEYLSSQKFTLEFLVRINSDFYNYFALRIQGGGGFILGSSSIGFECECDNPVTNPHANHSNKVVAFALSGVDRLATNYYLDRDWHHVVCRFDGVNGILDIWVDGQTGLQLKNTFSVVSSGCTPHLEYGNWYTYTPRIEVIGLEDNGSIDLDEIAFYNDFLPDQLVIQHYNDTQSGQHYSCTANSNIVVPSPTDYLTGSFDSLDFAPNHPFDSFGVPQTLDDYGSSVPLVLDQLKGYPLPRLKKGHGLNPNFNWMDNQYLGSLNKSFNGQNDVDVQEELCKNWNYMFCLGLNASHGGASYQGLLNNFANTNNQYKISLGTNINFLTNQTSVTPDYLNASSACSLPTYFAPNPNTKSYFNALGQANLSGLITNIINVTNDTLTANIDYISENGFEYSFSPLRDDGCPYPVQPTSLNIFTNTYGSNWQSYYGFCRKELENEYRDQVIGMHPRIPSSCKYSKYLLSAVYEHSNFEDYLEKRSTNTPIINPFNNNFSYHYATPPFYPFHPYLWSSAYGGNWGWTELLPNGAYTAPTNSLGRMQEIATGDSLFAPFVAAGWMAEYNNMRPGQWLGLVKGLGMLGADYYHTSYFNVTTGGTFATGTTHPVDPKSWCYQAVIPTYAQGITSRFEKFLHTSPITYHKARNQTIMVVRNYVNPANGTPSDKFLIYGSLQQMSNIMNNSPQSTIYHISDTTSGAKVNDLKFEIRRQGSTYIYDDASSVFYQLDKWHEGVHPSYWSKDFEIEAELNDYTDSKNSSGVNDYLNNTMNLKTYKPSGTASKDYTQSTTCVHFPSSGTTKNNAYYYLQPRQIGGNSEKKYYLWFRLRSTDSLGTQSKMDIDINKANGYSMRVTIPCIDTALSNRFKWYNFFVPQDSVGMSPISGLAIDLTTNAEHEIKVMGHPNLEFDKFIISEDAIPSGVDTNEIATSCLFSNRSPVGIQNARKNIGSLSISPNPSTGLVSVSCIPGSEFLSGVNIFDTQGHLLQTRFFPERRNNVQLDLKELGKGIYIIETQTNLNIYKRKIVLVSE